ncbi:hypothetical protein HKX48_008297 [Thoreauomyces humboldtii]|nr:hypothetical protein HKX48_008297 [Thoreauomyces humboldtii]
MIAQYISAIAIVSLVASVGCAPALRTAAGKICSLPFHAADDDIQPLLRSIYDSCVALNPGATLLVPVGTHELASNIEFQASVPFTLQIDGRIEIPFIPTLVGTMIQFTNCNNIVVTGSGSIFGNGALYRPNRDLSRYPNRPRLLRLQNCTRSIVENIQLINSPKFHLTLYGDYNTARNVTITADHIGETDGIDVSGNYNHVHDVQVENGDECVTVKSPTTHFRAENLVCRFTAGCNIGSFGNSSTTSTAAVSNVTYTNVTLVNSEAGVLVKAYPISTGVISDLLYQDFTLTNVAYPIDLDLFWCHPGPCGPPTGNLVIERAVFKNFVVIGYPDWNNTNPKAPSSRPVVHVHCLPGTPCSNIDIVGLDRTGSAGYAPDSIQSAQVVFV